MVCAKCADDQKSRLMSRSKNAGTARSRRVSYGDSHWFRLLVAALYCCPLAVFAGPPFMTDDPEPVEYQHWEIYVASQHTKTSEGWAGSPAMIEVNYGVISNVQLHVIAPLAYLAPTHGNTCFGYGDMELGAKYRFIQETPDCPQVGIFPLLEVPTGDHNRGLGSGHLDAFLPLWLQKSWGQEGREWTAYGGGGYCINPGMGNRDWIFVGLVLQRQITKNVFLGGEIFHRTATQVQDEGDTSFNLATIIDFGEHHHLLLSAGRSIDGPTKFQTYAAYQLTFGP